MVEPGVRMPEREDEPEWLRLRLALWPECGAEQHEVDMGTLLADDDRAAVFVCPAEREGHLAGFVEIVLRPWIDGVRGGPVAVVEALFVDPAARGQGAGHALLAAAEAWATERGACAIVSDADADNQHGLDLHHRLGYEESGSRVRLQKGLDSAAEEEA
jgi:aminoglycoside 6'-N-acetyltransferase I